MHRDLNTTERWKRRPGTIPTESASTTETAAIVGGRVVTPDTVVDGGCVLLRGSNIAEVKRDRDPNTPTDMTIDATGKVVMPGLIDIHGDDIEQQLFPRSEAHIPTLTALVTADRINVLNGITTKYHAIAFENDPNSNRTVSLARELADEFDKATMLLGDNRFHARCEVTESTEAVRTLLNTDVSVDMVSLMNHTPSDGQFDDYEAFERRYVDGHNATRTEAEELAQRRKNTPEHVIRDSITTLMEAARASDIPIASHDDATAADIDRIARMGATISEFPVSMDAAERATELGLHTVMGAPNLVQGGSLWGNLAVKDAISADVVDVLCSDYHPPSLLLAPFVETGEPLPVRVARVTENPAQAVGLDDRGRLAEGFRADVLVVDPDPIPTVEHAFVNGEATLRTATGDRVSKRRTFDPAS